MSTPIKSLSLACRVLMDMHALNNEGSESNRLLARQIGIVTPIQNTDGKLEYQRNIVNAISGDMNKHIFADAFRDIALDLNLSLCEPCKALDPARMMGSEKFRDYVQSKPPIHETINNLLTCALDDICGIMITSEGILVKRKSAIEFGWTIGLPEITEVQEFIHARHAVTRLTRTKVAPDTDQDTRQQAMREKSENIGQMIFNRPASSGVYAFVAHIDVAAIGFNDVSQQYPDFVTDRDLRLRAVLMALSQMVLQPKGALTSTQLPHVVNIEGFISMSSSSAAAPLISPLASNFVERGADIAMLINHMHGAETIQLMPFSSNVELLAQIVDIVDTAVAGEYRR